MDEIVPGGIAYVPALQSGQDGPRLLHEAWVAGAVDGPGVGVTISYVWPRLRDPASLLEPAEWTDLFRAAGFLKIPNDATLTFPLTVYRGASIARQRRPSWTLDEAIARKHAENHRRDAGEAFVYSTVVGADAVLAYFNGRHEEEIVVDVTKLGDVAALDRFAAEPPHGRT